MRVTQDGGKFKVRSLDGNFAADVRVVLRVALVKSTPAQTEAAVLHIPRHSV